MKNTLTPNQIADYQENGFVIIEDFLSIEELETWRGAVEGAVTARADLKLAQSGQDSRSWRAGDSFYDQVFIQRINLWKDNVSMRDLILDPRLGQMATELAGTEGMRIWHDQALIKQPWANPTAWHLDNPYWSFHSRDAISIWIALDDATLENGCLYFLPGTHKLTTYDNVGIGQNMADIFKVYPDFASVQSVAAPMKAGSCSFHNALIVHGAGANMTPGYRRAMTCAFMPEGSVFNGKQNVLSDDQVAQLQIGDALADDAQNPLVYQRPKTA